MVIYNNNFSEVFNELLYRSKVSCYKICQFTAINQAYLSRLKNGKKINPSPEIIMKIALALVRFSDKIPLYEIEKLFNSVGRSINIEE